MKQTCVIVILAYFTWFQHKPRWNRLLNIKYIHFLHLISQNKMASASNFRTSLRHHNVIYTRATFPRTKSSAKWSVTAATLSRVTLCIHIRAKFMPFQVKSMFKQHVNLMIWTWILGLQTASRNELPFQPLYLQVLYLPYIDIIILTNGK